MLGLTVFFVLTTVVSGVSCANILYVAVLPSPSHHIWNEVVTGGLLRNGHNITMIGYEEPGIKSSNYTVIKLNVEEAFGESERQEWVLTERNAIQELLSMWEPTIEFAKHDLQTDAVKRLLDYPQNFFDLIIFDMTMSQHLYPLMDHFGNIPSVGVSPFGVPPYISDELGQHFYVYFPNFALPYTDEMSFFERLENAMVFALSYFVKSYYMKIMREITAEKFGDGVGSPQEYERRVALLLANYDSILDYPQPLPPQIIPVGGLNAKPGKKLPEDIQKIVDGAKHGVVFFSLGTNVNLSWLKPEINKIFLDTFSKMNETVLWKYAGGDLWEIPKNVITRKWFPQNDILAHPNVKLFISHNGLLSTHESIYHGVPIVGIPFFLDQINNARKTEAKQIGRRLNYRTLTDDVFYRTIREVLDNPIYKKTAKKLSKQFRDRLETPLERAVFWIEYVLRHKDVTNLSTKGRYMPLCHRENLDVIGVLIFGVLVAIYLVWLALKLAVKKLIFGKNAKVKQQ